MLADKHRQFFIINLGFIVAVESLTIPQDNMLKLPLEILLGDVSQRLSSTDDLETFFVIWYALKALSLQLNVNWN